MYQTCIRQRSRTPVGNRMSQNCDLVEADYRHARKLELCSGLSTSRAVRISFKSISSLIFVWMLLHLVRRFGALVPSSDLKGQVKCAGWPKINLELKMMSYMFSHSVVQVPKRLNISRFMICRSKGWYELQRNQWKKAKWAMKRFEEIRWSEYRYYAWYPNLYRRSYFCFADYSGTIAGDTIPALVRRKTVTWLLNNVVFACRPCAVIGRGMWAPTQPSCRGMPSGKQIILSI